MTVPGSHVLEIAKKLPTGGWSLCEIAHARLVQLACFGDECGIVDGERPSALFALARDLHDEVYGSFPSDEHCRPTFMALAEAMGYRWAGKKGRAAYWSPERLDWAFFVWARRAALQEKSKESLLFLRETFDDALLALMETQGDSDQPSVTQSSEALAPFGLPYLSSLIVDPGSSTGADTLKRVNLCRGELEYICGSAVAPPNFNSNACQFALRALYSAACRLERAHAIHPLLFAELLASELKSLETLASTVRADIRRSYDIQRRGPARDPKCVTRDVLGMYFADCLKMRDKQLALYEPGGEDVARVALHDVKKLLLKWPDRSMNKKRLFFGKPVGEWFFHVGGREHLAMPL